MYSLICIFPFNSPLHKAVFLVMQKLPSFKFLIVNFFISFLNLENGMFTLICFFFQVNAE